MGDRNRRRRRMLAAMWAAVLWVVALSGNAGAEVRNPGGLAVIIGNSEYRSKDIPPVDYAGRDAEAFRRYVVDVLGYDPANVIHMKNATRREMLEVLGDPAAAMNDIQARLNILRGSGEPDVVVYYSGHGVPGKDGKPFLLPVDVPPHAARVEGYPVRLLYEKLGQLRGAGSVRVFLDTCFSGSSDGGRLVTGSPVYQETAFPGNEADRMTVLTAVTSTQIATWDRKARHGLFTHHLLDALHGRADADKDGKVTALEAKEYLDRHMTSAAWLSNRREQNATLRGAAGVVLARAKADGTYPGRPGLAPVTPRAAAPPPPAASAPPQPPAGHVAAEKALGLKREARVLVQQGLTALKYEVGYADGLFGKRTRGAIEAWQKNKGLPETGYLTREQAEALKAVGEEAGRQVEERGRKAKELAERKEKEEAERKAKEERERRAREAAARKTRELAELTRPGRKFRDCPECPEMVVVPAGSFRMGSPDDEKGRYDDEGPVRRVRIPEAFAVGRYEVTVEEYRAFVGETGRDMSGGCRAYDAREDKPQIRHDHSWEYPGYRRSGRDPVVCVSWEDAKAYVEWLGEKTGKGYRLLSEAEWEYAARAGTTTRRYWGDDEGERELCKRANGAGTETGFPWRNRVCGDGYEHTSPVGTFGSNAWGLYDVVGNVWEWVEDCSHENYNGAPSGGEAWVSGGNCGERVLRGGSWNSKPGNLRSAVRDWSTSGIRYSSSGFRIARTLIP